MKRRRSPWRGRIPAGIRRTDWEAWAEKVDPRGHTLLHPPSWLHARLLVILGAVALICGVASVVTLGMDAPGGWELALRLLSLALVVTALAFCIRAVRRHDPRRGYLGNLLVAVAALVAAVAVAGIAAGIST